VIRDVTVNSGNVQVGENAVARELRIERNRIAQSLTVLRTAARARSPSPGTPWARAWSARRTARRSPAGPTRRAGARGSASESTARVKLEGE
jgi:hypothetical protein